MPFTLIDDRGRWQAHLHDGDTHIATSVTRWESDADVHYDLLQIATGPSRTPDTGDPCHVHTTPDPHTGQWTFTVTQAGRDMPLLTGTRPHPTREQAAADGRRALTILYAAAAEHVPARWATPRPAA